MGKYTLWKAELAEPVPESDRASRTVDPSLCCGFWRISAARTKVSYPVAIWPQDGGSGSAIFFMIGVGAKDGQSMFDTVSNPERVEDFFHNGSWLKCSAVTEDAYHAAMERKHWPDGQQSRQISETERLDLVPDTPADQGGNNPVGDDGHPVDLFHQQVVSKIEAELAKIPGLTWPFKTLDEANKAAEIIESLRGLGRQGEAKRKLEKQPFIDGGAAVDQKWIKVKDASDAIQRLVSAVESFKRAEVARLQKEADEKEKIERERLEAESRKMAEQYGTTIDDEALKEMVDQKIASIPAPVIEAPRVGTSRGRAVSKAHVRTARIVDLRALAEHFIHAGDEDFTAYLQKRADAAARAKITLPGTKIDD